MSKNVSFGATPTSSLRLRNAVDTTPSPPTLRVRRPLCIEFWLREGRLKSLYSITVTNLLNFTQPVGTSKWSLSEKFRNWELVLGRKLVLGTASQFVIRKHEKFSQWIILSNLKIFGSQSFRKRFV